MEKAFTRGIVVIRTGFLTQCGAPAVVHVDVDLPFIRVTDADEFTGDYVPLNYDSYVWPDNVSNIFFSENTSNRIVFFDNDTVLFAKALGGDENTLLVFENETSFNWTVIDPPEMWTLKDPERINDLSYMQNKWNPYFYTTSVCDFRIGTLDENLQLKYPYCIEGSPCGGHVIYGTGEFPIVPIFVDRNPAYDVYKDDCVEFYPRNASFAGFGTTGSDGAIYNRMVADQFLCYAPLLLPDIVLENDSPKERSRQCFLLGGELATRTGDVCTRPIAWARCKVGFIYFGGYCYYKFDLDRESYAKVVSFEAIQTCAAIDSDLKQLVEPLSSAEYELKMWLRLHYIFWKRQSNITFRVPVVNTNCDCYVLVVNDPDNPYDDEYSVDKCNCHSAIAFPICRYHMKHHEIVDAFVSQSPLTIKTLRDGQYGAPWQGHPLKCSCENGWTGEVCEIPTCPFPVSEQTDDPTSIFFNKCYANKRGHCNRGNVRRCACFPNYSPPGSLITGENVDYPCACPASSITYPYGLMNDVRINNTGICSGSTKGSCRVDDFSNAGECICETRVRTSLDFAGETEFAFDGKSCACRIPKLFTGENIVQKHCNAHGTCCPFGETVYDDYENPTACDPDDAGCVCDNGWTGEACTCESPLEITEYTISINPNKVIINGALKIYVTEPLDGCVLFHEEPDIWECNATNGVFPYSSNATIYADWFPPCGVGTNPFAGRFSAQEVNRRYGRYAETQPIQFAPYGCTNSACMCDADHMGTLCRVGVSAITLDGTKIACGESTLPKRGIPTDDGCECKSITTDAGGIFGAVQSIFTGEACECALIYNPNTKVRELCANHGTCIPPHFPYGTCSKDYTQFLADSLYTPFIAKTYLDGEYSEYLFAQDSIIKYNGSYYQLVEDTIRISFVQQQILGQYFDTCNSHTKFTTKYGIRFVDAFPLIKKSVGVNYTLWSLVNDCVGCTCDGNGDLLIENPSCLFTNTSVTTVQNSHKPCRGEWTTEIDPFFFNNSANNRELDWIRTCVHDFDITFNSTMDIFPTQTMEGEVEMTCATANRTAGAYSYNKYGTLLCNNVVHRNIDQALYMKMGNYSRQCEREPITKYSSVLGEYYGLFYNALPGLTFDGETWTAENYQFIGQLLNHKRYSAEIVNEQLLDDYLVSWIDNIIVTTKKFVELQPSYEFNVVVAIFLSLASYASTGVVYEFGNETSYYLNHDNNPGSPLREFFTFNNSIIDVFHFGRNYTDFYRKPGIATVLPSYRRNNDTSMKINALRVTLPFDLEYMELYNRNGTHCATILTPKKGDVVEITCRDSDPFLYDDNAFDLSNENFANSSWGQLYNETGNISVVFNYLALISTEGVQVKLVPLDFYSIAENVDVAFSIDTYYEKIDELSLFLNNPIQHHFGPDPQINNGEMYHSDWVREFQWDQYLNDTISTDFFDAYNSMFDVGYVSVSFNDAWKNLTDRIYLNHTLPYNVLLDNVTGTPLNYSSEEDLKYLRDIWHTFLAPRQCSTNAECFNNDLGEACVFSRDNYTSWRSGDMVEDGIGDEGGCLCDKSYEDGFFKNFCDECWDGYGPIGDCKYPFAYNRKCGPGGSDGVTVEQTHWNITVKNYKKGGVRECLAIVVDSLMYERAHENEDVDLYVQSWMNGTEIINKIGEEYYLNNSLIVIDECLFFY